MHHVLHAFILMYCQVCDLVLYYICLLYIISISCAQCIMSHKPTEAVISFRKSRVLSEQGAVDIEIRIWGGFSYIK